MNSMVSTRWSALLCGLFLAACSSDEQPLEGAGSVDAGAMSAGQGPWTEGRAVPGVTQPVGDPNRGRELVLNGGYMGCGVPARLMDNPLLGAAVNNALGPVGNGAVLEGRNEKNRKVPYTRNVFESTDGVDVVNVSCLMCHAGSFNGKLVLGLGAADADFTNGFGVSDGTIGGGTGLPANLTALLGMSAAESANLNKILTRSAVFTRLTAMRTVGQNPAEIMAVTLMAHHEPDLTWSDAPVIDWKFTNHAGEPMDVQGFPSDPPPWWRAKKKGALFYNAMARGDHSGSMALATSICVDSVEQATAIGAMFRDMHAYVLTLEAPKYPFAIYRDLADKGKVVFGAECAGCHGTYGDSDAEDTYPNLLIPLPLIGTDPVVAEAGVVYAPHMVKAYNQTYYGKVTPFIVDDPEVGYAAPPLDGVWATGPFLHNGSVPSIALVLDSASRPAFWRRQDYDSTHFDEDALGFPFEALEHGQAQASAVDKKHIYDTTFFGHSNAGHTFGDKLTKTERRAVLEYLKTL